MTDMTASSYSGPKVPLRMIVFLVLCGIWGSTWLFIKLGL